MIRGFLYCPIVNSSILVPFIGWPFSTKRHQHPRSPDGSVVLRAHRRSVHLLDTFGTEHLSSGKFGQMAQYQFRLCEPWECRETPEAPPMEGDPHFPHLPGYVQFVKHFPNPVHRGMAVWATRRVIDLDSYRLRCHINSR
jgi:hypothetical protein